MQRPTFRPALRLMLVLTALCCASCQGGKVCYPVRGQVFVNGQPAAGVMVVLHAIDDPDPNPVQPSGVVQADGSFTLKSFFVQDRVLKEGAPAGKYRVTCVWYPADLQKHLGQEKLPDKLQGHYADPKTSGLQVEVLERETELSSFQLKTSEK
jgi:hypothetical protein